MQSISTGANTPTSTLQGSSPAPAGHSNELRGVAMVLVATVAWSFAGIFTRALTIDVATATAWRSFAGAFILLIIYVGARRSRALHGLTALRWPDWAAVLCSIVAQAAYSACLFLTSVAHVAVIYAATPFIAALIAWFWLGERLRASSTIAILVSMAGIVIVVAGSSGTGSLVGDGLALVMTTAFAVLIVMPKAYPALRITETMIVSGFLTFLIALPFSHNAALDLRNGILVGAYGAINLVLAYFLFMQGSRLIPAATAGLLVTLEIVLSPLWVWLFVGETVDPPTMLGGAIVLCAVIGHLLRSSLDARHNGRRMCAAGANQPL